MRKLFSIINLVCVVAFSSSALAAEASKPLSPEEKYVSDLGNRIITLIRSTDKMDEKRELFRGILQSNFDMKSIGKFVLSRFWKQADDKQKAEFLKLFEQNMVDTYTSQFDQYKDESMTVQGSRKDDSDGAIWVNAKVQGSAREPVNIRWKLYDVDGKYKVYDIHVNEVSMCITHRSEYASIIGECGGKIDGLLTAMRENKTARKKDAAAS